MIKNLKYVIDALEFMEKMKYSHSCNDCGVVETCEYRPEWGKPVRWNCPHWKGVNRNEKCR
jgi:hypothetical protein